MPQETMSQSGALRRSFDETRNVGHDKTAVLIYANDSQVRSQRGERIVRHLGPRRGDCSDQSRFAGVRHTKQSDVRQHLELQTQPPVFTPFTRCRLPRRAIGARLEMQIAESASSSTCDECALSVDGKIGNQVSGVGIDDHRSHRHPQNDVLGTAAVLIGAPFRRSRRDEPGRSDNR